MRKSTSIIILSTLSFMGTPAIAITFDPVTHKVVETQDEINQRHDKDDVENWALAHQADGKGDSALYFANKNHADLKALRTDYSTFKDGQTKFNQATATGLVGLAKGIDASNTAISNLQADNEDLSVAVSNNGKAISGVTNTVTEQGSRISELETTTVRQPALENEANARIQESEDRIKGDADLNQRVDGSYAVLANHEDRLVSQEAAQKDTAGRINVIRTEQARQANKQIETDRTVSSVNDTAKRGVSIASKSSAKADDAIRTNEQQNAWITDVQTKADTAVSKVPVFEKGIDEAHERINGLDRKTDQTANDASYARGKADFADQSATQAHQRINGLDAKTDVTNAVVADHETRITSNTNRVANVESGLAQTNDNVNVVYHNTQINAQNIDTLNKDVRSVDRASIERSKAAVFESKAYTDATAQALEAKMDRQYNKVRKEAFAGVAGVAAMTNMPFIPGEGWAVSASTGFYKNASAAAMGLQYQPSATDAFRVSGSISNGGEGAFGAGFTHHF